MMTEATPDQGRVVVYGDLSVPYEFVYRPPSDGPVPDPGVFCILHDGTGKVLIVKKNSVSYFSCKGKHGTIYYPNGKWLHYGGGHFCFPGGGLEGGQSPVDGAKLRFFEQTGIALEDIANTFIAHPPMREFSDCRKGRPCPSFYAYFHQVSIQAFGGAIANIKHKLQWAKEAVANIKDPKHWLINCFTLNENYSGSIPQDNVLDYVKIMNLNDPIDQNTIRAWRGDKKEEWFYCILYYLADELDIDVPGFDGIPYLCTDR